MKDIDGYQINVVVGKDGHSFTARTCLQRPSDGHFAVGYVERIPFKGDEDRDFRKLVTPAEQLNFSTEDAAAWDWWPTLKEAVEASKVTFVSFEKWTANAKNH